MGFEQEAIYKSFSERLGLLEWEIEPQYGAIKELDVENSRLVEEILGQVAGTRPLVKTEPENMDVDDSMGLTNVQSGPAVQSSGPVEWSSNPVESSKSPIERSFQQR